MATPTAPPDDVLDLKLFPTRPIVRIDNKPYELKTSNDLSLAEFKTIERIGPRISLLTAAPELTATEAGELSAHLDAAVRMILIAPDEIHRQLGDLNRTLIAARFFELLPPSLLQEAATAQGATTRPGFRPGSKYSRGSSRSTAATRPSGSATSRSASSTRATG